MQEEIKKCRKCPTVGLENFHRNNNNQDGLHNYCKDCRNGVNRTPESKVRANLNYRKRRAKEAENQISFGEMQSVVEYLDTSDDMPIGLRVGQAMLSFCEERGLSKIIPAMDRRGCISSVTLVRDGKSAGELSKVMDITPVTLCNWQRHGAPLRIHESGLKMRELLEMTYERFVIGNREEEAELLAALAKVEGWNLWS